MRMIYCILSFKKKLFNSLKTNQIKFKLYQLSCYFFAERFSRETLTLNFSVRIVNLRMRRQ